MSQQAIQLLVGLGNPGTQYRDTRHNVGAVMLRRLADEMGAQWRTETKFKGEVARLSSGQWLLFPNTYMNQSGEAVQAIMKFYKIPSQAVMVLHDDLDFPVGTVRLKFSGGHGGHNGLRNIMQHEAADFWRMRIGIGHPGHPDRVHDYVLQRANARDSDAIAGSIDRALAVIPQCLQGEFAQATEQLHQI